MTWDEWIAANQEALKQDGTPYERLFVEIVLRNVPSLSPQNVSAQTPFRDLAGRPRRIDFTIAEGESVRIALEVDGWSKTGTHQGQTYTEFLDWSYRELSMTAAGWVPLRFANGLIKRKPQDLRETIELQLKLQRRVEAAIRAGGDTAETARNDKRQLRAIAEGKWEGEDIAETKLRNIERHRATDARTYLSEDDSVRLQSLQNEIEELNDELLHQRKLRKQSETENRGMKVMGIVFAVVLVSILVSVLLQGTQNNSASAPGNQVPNDSEIAMRCDNARPVDELSLANSGETVTVKGEVAGTRKVEGDSSRVYLNLGQDYPDQNLAVVIWGDDLGNWTTPPEAKYDSRVVAVAGEVKTYQGSLQIAANSPNDVVICP